MYGGEKRVNLRIKCPLLISDFNKNWIVSTNNKISIKVRQNPCSGSAVARSQVSFPIY
jgi:hypothetical protein